MKKMYTFIFILCMWSSCKKSPVNSDIYGTWKLVRMIHKSTGTIIFPPPNATKFAGITFQLNGTFYGNTLYNTFSDGFYKSEGTNKLNFIQFSSTKIYDDEWGRNFTEVLMSCYLQSLSPCIQPSYLIKGNQLTIYSVTQFDLIFVKE